MQPACLAQWVSPASIEAQVSLSSLAYNRVESLSISGNHLLVIQCIANGNNCVTKIMSNSSSSKNQSKQVGYGQKLEIKLEVHYQIGIEYGWMHMETLLSAMNKVGQRGTDKIQHNNTSLYFPGPANVMSSGLSMVVFISTWSSGSRMKAIRQV